MLIKGVKYRTATDFQKLLYITGIPQRYWSVDAKSLKA